VTLAILPAFLGLFVVLPVLGHATWHLYRARRRWGSSRHNLAERAV
jgi:uncharacterized membrane protein